MRKCKITVWDYDDRMHGISFPLNKRERIKPRSPVKYEVEAWCVQGETGFRAYFFLGDQFCEANGDDGHWWLMSTCHKHWVKEIKEAINAVERDSSSE